MKDTSKKVIIMDNFSSPYISQAIIVLKEYNPQLEGHIITEAEKIVADYIDTNYTKIRKKERQKTAVHKNNRIRQKKRPRLTVPVLFIVVFLAIFGAFYALQAKM